MDDREIGNFFKSFDYFLVPSALFCKPFFKLIIMRVYTDAFESVCFFFRSDPGQF